MVERQHRAGPTPMLELTRLGKSYPTPRGPLEILSDVSLSLSRGDAAAIMGPSGSGKSTLLYILGALEPPTSGTVTLDGRNPFELPEKALAAFRNKQVGVHRNGDALQLIRLFKSAEELSKGAVSHLRGVPRL